VKEIANMKRYCESVKYPFTEEVFDFSKLDQASVNVRQEIDPETMALLGVQKPLEDLEDLDPKQRPKLESYILHLNLHILVVSPLDKKTKFMTVLKEENMDHSTMSDIVKLGNQHWEPGN
jgi:hypothetical protein